MTHLAALAYVLLITVFHYDGPTEVFSTTAKSTIECTALLDTFLSNIKDDSDFQGATVKPECLLISVGGELAKNMPFDIHPIDGADADKANG